MSVSNNKAPVSIFDSQDSNELKERQRLEELKRQAKVQQVKLDKRLNKQKILMGAFLGQVLATDGESEQMIREYFAIHFPDFLTRKSDKELFKSMIESLGGDIGLDEGKDSSAVNMQTSSHEAENNQQNESYSNAEHDIRDLLSDDNTYSTDVSDPNYRG
ncbi:hypothetical protein FOR85_11760 [Psychrobacter sp. YGAH215]|uniref:hypothetical protein n=1 Tax=Psychrobacter sp. YGAH215 TaxID=2596826 RepID=UPI001184941C|nr:hypothetical protein [Psychrobacter sp. YGAH215]TSB21904.1 hypothetical protein FOR85_11760 [Psychrobacter sp. YGAH215]